MTPHEELLVIHEIACCGWANVTPIKDTDTLTVRDVKIMAMELMKDSKTSVALCDVAAERRRQIESEGMTSAHDDAHASGEMAMAGACYAAHAVCRDTIERGMWKTTMPQIESAQRLVHNMWPWDRQWWKPKTHRRDLVRAAALIIAEIERLDRATQKRAAA